MYIQDYKYFIADVDCGDHLEVDGIVRDEHVTEQYIERVGKIVLTKPTAVLYSAGVTVHQSEGKNATNVKSRYYGSVPQQEGSRMIKELSSYSLHKWIGMMENNHLVEYASVNGNSCASSMYSIYEAERLLRDGEVDEVIVITEEKTSFNTIRIFKEHGIPIVVSDGFAMVRFGNEPTKYEVVDTKWKYEYNRNPFATTVAGYEKVDNKSAGVVKPHGTYTGINDEAEKELVKDREAVYYKPTIGHSQGASALIELCMAIDDEKIKDEVLCVASGLGNHYGSCVLRKI